MSGDYNAKIIGYTKDGDVIIRLAPNAQEDLMAQAPLNSSITWAEPIQRSTMGMEGNTSRGQSRARGRSISSVSYKGKEKEDASVTRDNHNEEVDLADADISDEDDKARDDHVEEV